MWSNEKKPLFLIDHIVCLFELPLHNRTHTHTHTAMITILHITGVQITAWLPRACQSTVIPQTL